MGLRSSVRKLHRTKSDKAAPLRGAAQAALELLENRLMLSVNHSPDFSGDVSDLAFNPTGPGIVVPRVTLATDTPPNAVQLTSGVNGQTASVWETTAQGVDTFDTTFDFTYGTVTAPGADGFTFTIQNSPATTFATGGGGGGLGEQGLQNSVAIKFDIYPGVSTTGMFLNGEPITDTPVQSPSTTPIGSGISVDLTAGGVNFHANPGDRFRCHLVYDGTTLTETVTDVTKNISVTQPYSVQMAGAVGDHMAYPGFTGATGGVNSEQDILSWTYTGTAGTGQLVLPTPTLSGQDSVPGQGLLTWNNPSGNAQGYEIDASTNNGSTFTVFDTTGQNPQMPYVAMNLDTTKTYLFKVKALGDGSTFQDSAFSRTVLIHGGGVVTQPVVHSPNFADVNDLTLNGGASGAHFTGAGVHGTVATPTAAPTVGQATGGNLTGGTTYFVTYAWQSAAANHGQTAGSPEAMVTLDAANGTITVTPPAAPPNAGNANVYIGTSSGTETLAGSVAGGQTLNITALPAAGAAGVPTVNTTFDTPANALQVVQSANNQAGSAFTTGLQLVSQFDTTFDFTFHSDNTTTADGMTFLIQDNVPTALGSSGGGLGYSSINHSVAVKFDLWNGTAGAPTTQTSTTGVFTNSNLNDNVDTNPGDLNTGYDLASNGIDFHANGSDVFRCHLVYDGTTLHMTLTDQNNPTSTFAMDFTIDIPTTIGSQYAYVGFTAATGGAHAEQDVLQWTMPTALAASQTINGTSGNDTITLKVDSADHTKDDVWVNAATTGAPTLTVSNAQTIVVNGAGGTDTLVLDSSNGNPVPTGGSSVLRLNSGTGTFSIGGTLPTLDATHLVDVGTSTVNIPYTGTSILPAVQSDLKNGFIKSSDAAGSSGKFAVADSDTGSAIKLQYAVIGDTNVDGHVNFTDLLSLAQNYNKTSQDWAHGDFNYDGVVNFSDLLALAQHYGQSSAVTAAASSSSLDLLASGRKAKPLARKR